VTVISPKCGECGNKESFICGFCLKYFCKECKAKHVCGGIK
jgi:hypothetical protein